MTADYAATDEKRDEARETELGGDLRQSRGIEVGHIFYFGDKYTRNRYSPSADPDGEPVTPVGGSYGIGVSRLVGAIIEASHDDAGIIWPEPVAPWQVGIVTMRADDDASVSAAETIYGELVGAGVDVLYDDRDERGGVKLGSMDLIGLPWQIIIGPRGIANGTVELKRRSTGEREELSLGVRSSKAHRMILNRAERMLTRRYLLPGKGEGFIFLVASISLIAVALGVAALIIVMSVMNGFRAELFDKIVGLNGHAVVQGYGGQLPDWQRIADTAKRTPGVTSAVPLIETPLMATANGRFEGVIVRGMRVEDIRANKTITSNVLAGDIKSIVPGSNRVAIGSRLADTLGAFPGSQITLWNPDGRSTVVGTVPREVTYTVGAVFEIGVYDYDKAFVILPMQDAQQLLLLGDQVGMIEIQTSNPDKVQEILAPLQKLVQGKGVITDWRQMNSALFEALEVERVAMFVVLSLIVLVAVFNILSSLIMLVRAKTRDIAILRTMGASRRGMMKVFMTVGVTIGSLGIVLGIVLGALFLFFRQNVVDAIQVVTGQNLWDPQVRFLTDLPVKDGSVRGHGDHPDRADPLLPGDALSAYKAASTDPVQVLRYE